MQSCACGHWCEDSFREMSGNHWKCVTQFAAKHARVPTRRGGGGKRNKLIAWDLRWDIPTDSLVTSVLASPLCCWCSRLIFDTWRIRPAHVSDSRLSCRWEYFSLTVLSPRRPTGTQTLCRSVHRLTGEVSCSGAGSLFPGNCPEVKGTSLLWHSRSHDKAATVAKGPHTRVHSEASRSQKRNVWVEGC